MSTVPSVRFALPGRWLKTELDDPAAVAALTDLLPDGQGSADAWLESLRAAGAQTLLLRVGSAPSAAIAFIWPTDQSRGESSAPALRARLGIDGDAVVHQRGYPTVRTRQANESSPRDVVTFALAHPDTGRILMVRCIAFDQAFPDIMVEDFDLAAGDLIWDET